MCATINEPTMTAGANHALSDAEPLEAESCFLAVAVGLLIIQRV